MKYIDADKLLSEINARIERCEKDEEDGYPDTTSSEATLKSIRSFITSLQQEQPSLPSGLENTSLTVDSFWSKKYWTKHRTSTTDMARELKLVLTYKWYDMIDSGEKPEEYRNLTTFYRRRLETGWSEPHLRWRKYDIVTFYRGYAKGRKTMSFKYGGCREGTGKEEWGAEPGKEYYVIKLGERIEHKNEPKLFEI